MANLPEYPFERIDYGATLEVAPGIHWVRMQLPFALNHVNLWLLEDDGGWAIVDTGYNDEPTRERWTAALARIAGDRPVTQLIVTHFHPDHCGLAGWFAEQRGAALSMTAAEWLQAHLNRHAGATADLEQRLAFFAANGLPEDALAGYRRERPDFARILRPVPGIYGRLMDGEEIAIGGRRWRVITGGGHSPDHAALWCAEANVLISGDQVLPRISTNVSVPSYEPGGDPLRLFLQSFDKFRPLPSDALVLPSHDRPFYGLHDRLAALDAHHADRLERTWDACAEPQTAAEMIPTIFDRALDAHQLGFAIGEALSHANYLVADGRLVRIRDADGLFRYRRV